MDLGFCANHWAFIGDMMGWMCWTKNRKSGWNTDHWNLGKKSSAAGGLVFPLRMSWTGAFASRATSTYHAGDREWLSSAAENKETALAPGRSRLEVGVD